MRNLVIVLGDQLDAESAAFDHFDRQRDVVWMAEVHEEATHVWCHKRRLVFFFSAMRHFCKELREKGITVDYHALGDDPREDRGSSFSEIFTADIQRLRPQQIVVLEPGDWRVLKSLQATAAALGVPMEVRMDRHFYCGIAEFRAWAGSRKSLVMENFYRHMRQKHGVLMEDGKPVGGVWNLDEENRESFGATGPPPIAAPPIIPASDISAEVTRLVEGRFADHPGSAANFDLPVTRRGALDFLRDFIEHRLEGFGPHEDAMWAGEPFLYHSRLSALLNVHLLHPRECVQAAVKAYESGRAPLNSVEGFVRQIIGWREFIRGIYWHHMPGYIEMNALQCDDIDVPAFFWNGDTDMACARDAMRSVLEYGYAHHIQRLMVLGLFSLLYGAHPRRFHEWHMAMYLDAIDWVSLPNTLGMSQHGDGGIVGTKPYCATGNYIDRMGNHCESCRYDPQQQTGPQACPFSLLYYDFLHRHREKFRHNQRMGFQMKNLEKKNPSQLATILAEAGALKARLTSGGRV